MSAVSFIRARTNHQRDVARIGADQIEAIVRFHPQQPATRHLANYALQQFAGSKSVIEHRHGASQIVVEVGVVEVKQDCAPGPFARSFGLTKGTQGRDKNPSAPSDRPII